MGVKPMLLEKEFYFVRHGQTDHNLIPFILKGAARIDISLNATGRKQAETLAPIVAGLPIQTICSSPLKRAQETKELITPQLQAPHHKIEELGECSGDLWHEMVRLGMQSYEYHDGGIKDFMDRVRNGLDRVLSLPGPSLVVAHGGVHWAICALMKIEEHDWAIDNCVLVHFFFANHGKWIAKKLS